MKILCILNQAYFDKEQIFLTSGKVYTVYVIKISKNTVSYGIIDDTERNYPVFYDAKRFTVTDRRLSKYWEYDFKQESEVSFFSFKEWLDDPYFWESLIDYQQEALIIFNQYKNLIDFEYPDPSKKFAISLEDNWVICPECSEGLQIQTVTGLIKCPKCLTILNNPFY